MDLKLYARVLCRAFGCSPICGLLLATLLAFMSYVNIGFANGKPMFLLHLPAVGELHEAVRHAAGFSLGLLRDSGGGGPDPTAPPSASTSVSPDQGRFDDLAILYAQLATE